MRGGGVRGGCRGRRFAACALWCRQAGTQAACGHAGEKVLYLAAAACFMCRLVQLAACPHLPRLTPSRHNSWCSGWSRAGGSGTADCCSPCLSGCQRCRRTCVWCGGMLNKGQTECCGATPQVLRCHPTSAALPPHKCCGATPSASQRCMPQHAARPRSRRRPHL